MEKSISMAVGVVVQRDAVDHPWADWSWRAVGVLPGAPPVEGWREICSGEGWSQFHAATVPLELHRKETEGYLFNLNDKVPALYVVMREDEDSPDGEMPYAVHIVTASPFEAQDYLDSGEDLVERIAMPPMLLDWVKAFVAEHHVEETYKKRKRDSLKTEEQKFGKEPIFISRKRASDGRLDG